MEDELIELINEVESLALRLKHNVARIKAIVYSNIKWDGRTIGDDWLMIYYATNLEWEADAIANAIGSYTRSFRKIVSKRKNRGKG